MNDFMKRLSNLLSIKSLVTLAMTALFAVMSVRGNISGEQVLAVFSTIVGFYFGTQAKKE